MAKKKTVSKVIAEQPEFGDAPKVEASRLEAPALVEYQPFSSGEKWRVEKFGLLVASVEMQPEGVAENRWSKPMEFLHVALCGHRRQWLIMRRLFGICPLIPTKDTEPEDLRSHAKEAVCGELGISSKELEAELIAVKAIYQTELGKKSAQSQAAETNAGLFANREELDFGEEILRKIGLDARAFGGDRATQEWFIEMAKGWKTVLNEPMVSTLAAQCLVNGLELRKIRRELFTLSATSEDYKTTKRLMETVEERYEKQMMTISKLCPWVGQVDGKISFKGTLTELIQGHQDYYIRGDMRLLDRVRTVGEIEVDHRRSVQRPHIQYRFGQTLFIVEAMHGLHDPNFRSQFTQQKLAKFDQVWRRLAEEGADEIGEPIPDLTKDGPEGEYPEVSGSIKDQG